MTRRRSFRRSVLPTKSFEETGITGFPYGHHYDGGKTSIHADYTLDPEYEAAMLAAYGKERMYDILSFNTHNTLYYPSLTIKSAVQNIRSRATPSLTTRRSSRPGRSG